MGSSTGRPPVANSAIKKLFQAVIGLANEIRKWDTDQDLEWYNRTETKEFKALPANDRDAAGQKHITDKKEMFQRLFSRRWQQSMKELNDMGLDTFELNKVIQSTSAIVNLQFIADALVQLADKL